MLKALDIVGLSWLTRLFSVEVRDNISGVADCGGVPIFKKGDQRVMDR